MHTLTLTLEDADVDVLSAKWRYQSTVTDEKGEAVSNPESAAAFVARHLEEHLAGEVTNGVVEAAKAAAEATAREAVAARPAPTATAQSSAAEAVAPSPTLKGK